MTDLSKRLAQLSPVKRALLALELDKRGNGCRNGVGHVHNDA